MLLFESIRVTVELCVFIYSTRQYDYNDLYGHEHRVTMIMAPIIHISATALLLATLIAIIRKLGSFPSPMQVVESTAREQGPVQEEIGLDSQPGQPHSHTLTLARTSRDNQFLARGVRTNSLHPAGQGSGDTSTD